MVDAGAVIGAAVIVVAAFVLVGAAVDLVVVGRSDGDVCGKGLC